MASNSQKPLVLIAGITGMTGTSIANALLADGKFRVAALVRKESLEKKATKDFQAAGVEIRTGDAADDSVEKLTGALQGVEILISTLVVLVVDQRNLFRAAKQAGVKRVVPSEFGPHVPRGVFEMADMKYAVRDFIKDLGLGHTFTEIGWWLEYMFPVSHSVSKESYTFETPYRFIGDGAQRLASTSRRNIGRYVARIIADPRTLNQAVLTWDVEISTSESWALSERISGEDFSDYQRVSVQNIKEKLQQPDLHLFVKTIYGYLNSLFIRGDNTVERAVADGVLDARALYPDFKAADIEEEAREYYTKGLDKRPAIDPAVLKSLGIDNLQL